jgi:hypothetical protein
MSYTKLNYPAALASEGNPLAHGGFPGDLDPYLHGVNDTIDIDDDTGFFSLDVSFNPIFVWANANSNSTWQDSQSWRLPSLWSRADGIIPGGKQFIRGWSKELH